jgi:hypothetical protein
MTLALVSILLLLALSGPFRALHEAPTHDDTCGLNAWAFKRFRTSRPKLHQWLDSRYSSVNKYRFAREVSSLLPEWLPQSLRTWVGNLFLGPLVSFTDAWHLSYTLSNITANVAMFLALTLQVHLWWVYAVGVTLLEDSTFEPVYRTLRNYR